MRGFFQVFKQDLLNTAKNPVLVLANTAFPLLLTLIMGFLTSGAYASAADAYRYYTVSFLIFGMLNGAMTSTNNFMERDVKRPNLRIIHSPVGSFSIHFSKVASAFLFDYICHLFVLLILVAALNLRLAHLGYVVLMMVPIEFAASALGVLFCCIFKTEETASTLLSTAISILAVLGGTFFSFDGMGGALAFLSRLSPVKWITDAFFAVIFDGNLAMVPVIFAAATVVSVLFVFGCAKLFRREDYLC